MKQNKRNFSWFFMTSLFFETVFILALALGIALTTVTAADGDSMMLAPIGNKTVNELETLNFTAQVINTDDEDEDDGDDEDSAFLFSLINAPEGATINAETGEFSWTPAKEQGPGEYSFTIRVDFEDEDENNEDGGDDGDENEYDKETIIVTVNEVNELPVVWEVDSLQIITLWDGGVFVPATGTASSTTAVNVTQEVKLQVTAEGGVSSVELPAGIVIFQTEGGEFSAVDINARLVNLADIKIDSNIVVVGALEWGIPNITLQFSNPITVSIFVGTNLNGQTLNVMRSVSGAGDWTADGIVSPATCIVNQGICAFAATKASFYSVTAPSVIPDSVSTSISSGGNDSAAASGISGYSQSFATPDEGGKIILLKSESEIQLNVPPGAVSVNTLFSITSSPLETYGKPDPASGLVKAGSLIFEISAADGTVPVTSFLKPLSIEFHYQESDILGHDENALVIHYWDKALGAWIALPSQVDAKNNIVSAFIEHLTVFSLMSRAKPAVAETAEVIPFKTVETFTKSAEIKPIKPKLEAIVVDQPVIAPAPETKEAPNGIFGSGWALIGNIYNYFMAFSVFDSRYSSTVTAPVTDGFKWLWYFHEPILSNVNE